ADGTTTCPRARPGITAPAPPYATNLLRPADSPVHLLRGPGREMAGHRIKSPSTVGGMGAAQKRRGSQGGGHEPTQQQHSHTVAHRSSYARYLRSGFGGNIAFSCLRVVSGSHARPWMAATVAG